jgi:hypothetical protein
MSASAAASVGKWSPSWQFLCMAVGQLAVGCGAFLLTYMLGEVQDTADRLH